MVDIASSVNWIDFLIVVILVRACYIGASRGFGQELFGSLGAVLALILSMRYFEQLGQIIAYFSPIELPTLLANALGFVAIAFGIIFIFKIIEAFSGKVVKVEFHSFINKMGGVVFGLLKGCLWISLLLLFLFMLPSSYLENSIRSKSLTGEYFLKIGPAIYMKLIEYISGSGPQETKKEDILDHIIAQKSSVKKVTAPPK